MNFTTTAMPRPDILDRCYSSFNRNILDVDLKKSCLYINVDPFPHETQEEFLEIDRLMDDTIDVAHDYFKHVVFRKSNVSNFTLAIKWLWSVPLAKTIIHIEDDWILKEPLNVLPLVAELINTELYQIVFRALMCEKYGGNYPCNCLSPSIFHRRYYRHVSKMLDDTKNPEHQMHRDNVFKISVPNKKTCHKYIKAYSDHIIVEDIGRGWLEKSPYKKPTSKTDFLGWEKKNNINTLEWLKNYGDI